MPCIDGIGHDPAQNARPDHLAAGATVLGERLRRLKKSGAEEVYEDVTLRHLLETTVMILSSADADVA